MTLSQSPYEGWVGTIATMHGKEAVIAATFRQALGVHLAQTRGLDTDAFGSFSGEIARIGSMMETAIGKARLGMTKMSVPIGVASEGSYGRHPAIPIVPGGIELMVFVDAERDIVIAEHLIDDTPVYDHAVLAPGDNLTPFLKRARFPEHAVIIRPHFAKQGAERLIFKGVTSRDPLNRMIIASGDASEDGMALIQTDMRAQYNPTRMATIGRLAVKLSDRVARRCPSCGTPGFGVVDGVRQRHCIDCGEMSTQVSHDALGCVKCSHRALSPRPGYTKFSDARFCSNCNP
ncbi:DUF6671 family protein [Bosea sp. (in: a-proteobacteria)]|uniref:DUF6671 family protein n=1 Tax=Bosea sp. (in: a-proteobacteria) TaxID=1871050 RepID=UPI002B484ED5|nr:DUF6671 family protein [Bosea sp. (in: a-proteobacteria)]WRH60083.1 MAG: DUF6671 family protein [Bosea sp. (in: a-proteobacteria)]